MKTKTPKKTRAQLERKILELQGSRPFAHHAAHTQIERANTDRLMGSACLLQLTDIGGKEIISPVLISDGLSPETLGAIRRDIKRSYDLATAFKID